MVAHNMVFKRSPDMELYNMMKVDTSAYKIDHNLLEQMKNDLTIMPNKPVGAAEDDSTTKITVGVVSVGLIILGVGICALNNRRKAG